MAKLLLNLRNVPDDEGAEVCALLDTHHIGWYQTPPSPWGISAGGIWLSDDGDLPRAKALMADYQARRGEQARAAHAEARRAGTLETFADTLRQRPGYVLAVLAAMLFIIGLTLALPFLLLR